MPLPPRYKCPVCQKELQRGHIGDHVISHTFEELRPYIINLTEISEKGTHPEVLCSGHTYIVCTKTKQCFEKGFIKHKRHECKSDYRGLVPSANTKPQDMQSMTMQQVLDVCRSKNLRGYSHKKKEEIIELILEHEKNTQQQPKQCTCHSEIIRLKEELLKKENELEKFRAWQDLVLGSAPNGKKHNKETELFNIVYDENLPGENPELQSKKRDENSIEETNVPIIPKLKPIKELKVFTEIKPSKKEQEKGMYCTKCEVCSAVARNNRELKPCGKCNKLCHFNSDFFSCYHWDCANCGLQICMDCNKLAGGNKLFSFCSKQCHKIHDG